MLLIHTGTFVCTHVHMSMHPHKYKCAYHPQKYISSYIHINMKCIHTHKYRTASVHTCIHTYNTCMSHVHAYYV